MQGEFLVCTELTIKVHRDHHYPLLPVEDLNSKISLFPRSFLSLFLPLSLSLSLCSFFFFSFLLLCCFAPSFLLFLKQLYSFVRSFVHSFVCCDSFRAKLVLFLFFVFFFVFSKSYYVTCRKSVFCKMFRASRPFFSPFSRFEGNAGRLNKSLIIRPERRRFTRGLIASLVAEETFSGLTKRSRILMNFHVSLNIFFSFLIFFSLLSFSTSRDFQRWTI